MSGHLRIYAELRGHGAYGPRYRVHMNTVAGMVIIDATTEPLFAAARLLLSQGVTGKLQLWDSTRPYCRMQGEIERLASMTVSEGQGGMCLRKYAERTVSGEGGPIGEFSPVGASLSLGASERTYITSTRSAVAA